MGLIVRLTDPEKMTVLEKQVLTKQQMVRIVSDLFDQMKIVYDTGSRLVQKNPLGLTKEQVIQGFGADAQELVRLATLLKDAINIAVPGTIEEPDPYVA